MPLSVLEPSTAAPAGTGDWRHWAGGDSEGMRSSSASGCPREGSGRAGQDLAPHQHTQLQHRTPELPLCCPANISPDSNPAKIHGLAHPLLKFPLKICFSSKENVIPWPCKSIP